MIQKNGRFNIIRSRAERRHRAFQKPKRDAAHQRADRIAEAAEHGDDKAFELIAVAGENGERKQSADQHAGHAGERYPAADRDRENARGWNADELGGLAIVGDRTQRLAEPGVMQKEIEQRRDHRGKHRGKNMRPGKSVAVDGEPGQRDLDQTAVPSPTKIRWTEKVDNRLINGGRPIMRWTAIQ